MTQQKPQHQPGLLATLATYWLLPFVDDDAAGPNLLCTVFASIVIPVARLVVRVIFPPHYKIKNGQCKVTMIGSSIRCAEEEKRVKNGRFFKSRLRKKDDRLALELNVIEPKLFRTYALIWSPMER